MSPTVPFVDLPVRVSDHARDRYVSRLGSLPERHAAGAIIAEVREALEAGRTSHKPPPGVQAKAARPGIRYAWGRGHCFVIACNESAYCVLTMLYCSADPLDPLDAGRVA